MKSKQHVKSFAQRIDEQAEFLDQEKYRSQDPKQTSLKFTSMKETDTEVVASLIDALAEMVDRELISMEDISYIIRYLASPRFHDIASPRNPNHTPQTRGAFKRLSGMVVANKRR